MGVTLHWNSARVTADLGQALRAPIKTCATSAVIPSKARNLAVTRPLAGARGDSGQRYC